MQLISEMFRAPVTCKMALGAAELAALLTVAPAAAQNQPAPAPTPQTVPQAQPAPTPQAQPAPSAGSPVAIPGFWDPKRRPERPDISRITVIRFLTEVDYPPFNYAGP